MVTASFKIEAQLTAGAWTDLSRDLIAQGGLSLRYGIDGNGPMDLVAGTGELRFTLRNDAGNSGGAQGYYSPLHVSKRAGWGLGIPVRAVFASGTAASVTSLTSAGLTATATTSAPHGLITGQYVTIAGASPAAYNGTWQITVTGADTFTYQLSSTAGVTSSASIWLILQSFTGPTSPATGTITWIQAYIKFTGKIGAIVPAAGQFLSRRVEVSAYDSMRDLMEAEVREVDIAVDQDEATLLTRVLDALPAEAQPLARSLDSGVDVFPYAFDNIGGGVRAGGLIHDIAVSSYGTVVCTGPGTFTYRNRHSRILASSAFTFNNTMRGLLVPSSTDKQYNRIRATTHPKRIDSAMTALYEQTGEPLSFAPGQEREIWGDYRSANDKTRLIGGVNRIAPLEPGIDYRANDESDGTGIDRTDSLVVTVDDFATTAKFTIRNDHSSTVFLRVLQIRGNAVLDDGPQTFEAPYVPQPYGEHPLAIDLPYQDDPYVGESAAIYIGMQHGVGTTLIDSLEFHANASAALMAQALAREPGDVITVTEPVTGAAGVQALIQRVEFELLAPATILCRWGLAPRNPFIPWQLGVAGLGELGETTKVGF